jgi:hypothetical protein
MPSWPELWEREPATRPADLRRDGLVWVMETAEIDSAGVELLTAAHPRTAQMLCFDAAREWLMRQCQCIEMHSSDGDESTAQWLRVVLRDGRHCYFDGDTLGHALYEACVAVLDGRDAKRQPPATITRDEFNAMQAMIEGIPYRGTIPASDLGRFPLNP